MLTESLKCTLEARLLHQGATTEDILIAYVSAIRAFSVLDPTGVLLDVACDPIKYDLVELWSRSVARKTLQLSFT